MASEQGSTATAGNAAAALERGEVVFYPVCPFALPRQDDLDFLLQQQLSRLRLKNITYNPGTGRVTGFAGKGGGQGERFEQIFSEFSRATTAWLAATFPRYAAGWKLDRATFRPEEEATRRLRHTARNDLLHVDAFPTRPTGGDRIFRVFVNINPSEPRVWVTSDPFARLLERYGEAAGLPRGYKDSLLAAVTRNVLRLFRGGRPQRTPYDSFMLRFHDFLKLKDEFQERAAKRIWHFPPGSCWLAMTDACSHAVLRGRYSLEHSYFVPHEVLLLPDESPASLLRRACQREVLRPAG